LPSSGLPVRGTTSQPIDEGDGLTEENSNQPKNERLPKDEGIIKDSEEVDDYFDGLPDDDLYLQIILLFYITFNLYYININIKI